MPIIVAINKCDLPNKNISKIKNDMMQYELISEDLSGDTLFVEVSALKKLNKVGYGQANSNLKLDLVYNPSGAFLPPDQSLLEIKFKEKLYTDFKIEFNNLFTITNLPISRFLDYLIASENYEEYMETLVSRFNPNATKELMCKNTISVSWEGYIYDCDFNQMLDLKINSKNNTVFNCKIQGLVDKKIQVSQHCYGCTAGAGSSCQGTIA